nr:photosystem II protein M [Corydalis platycarpa]UZM11235.1 photosystem II protein M [Corydalis platycarpa]
MPSYSEVKKKKTALFILVPTAFLLIIYVKTVSQND